MWELESTQSLVKLNPRSKALKNGRRFKPKRKSHCPPFPLLLFCHFSHSADGLLDQSKQRPFSSLAQFHALNY